MIKEHPYLAWYLFGVVLVVLLIAAKMLLVWSVAWLTKGNVVEANLKKLNPPAAEPVWRKVGKPIAVVLFEALLSWINVIGVIWQISRFLLRTVRELMLPVPERVKELRFPLRNNPNLSLEAVWAYFFALTVVVGDAPPDEPRLLSELDDVRAAHPEFASHVALRQLAELHITKPEIIAAVESRLASKGTSATVSPEATERDSEKEPDLTDELMKATYLLGVSELERAPQDYGYAADGHVWEPSDTERESGTVSMVTLGKAISRLSPVDPARRVLEEIAEEHARETLDEETAGQLAENHKETRSLEILRAGLKARVEKG